MSGLLADVRALLAEAAHAAAGTPWAAEVARLGARLDEPLRLAIAGRVKAGKSTLLNALVGEELAPTDARECTRVVTWYRDSHTYRVVLHPRTGEPRQVPFRRDEGALDVSLGMPLEDVDHLEVEWPSSRLGEVTLIDTPGTDSPSLSATSRTREFFAIEDADDERAGQADAVLYLMKHLHATDLGFLEAFRDDEFASASPISTVAVLSRADEAGACRLDAMAAAHRIASAYRDDPRLRRLAQTVIPVAGLVAQASLTLTEAQFRAIRAIASLPRADADALVLTADRFCADDPAIAVTAVEREDLLGRLGMFGVRLAVSLVRLGGADSAASLAAELRRRSGIDELRGLLRGLFTQRRDVLKARAVLAGIEGVARELGPQRAAALNAALERVAANAHELTEIHLLNSVRSGALVLRPQEAAELERLCGNLGGAVAERVEVPAGSDARSAVLAALARWQARAENPLSSRDVQVAARAVARTYEGLLRHC